MLYLWTSGMTRIGRATKGLIERERMRRRLVPCGERKPRKGLEVLEARVAPPGCFPLLNRELRLNVAEARAVDRVLQRVPLPLHRAHGIDAGVVPPNELFPQRPIRCKGETLRPRHVMEPQQHRIGHCGAARITIAYRSEVLAHGVRAGSGPIEPQA